MDFISYKRMPADLGTHQVDEVQYNADGVTVRGLLVTPKQSVERIVVYLRGGKGQVGRVRLGRMLQFVNTTTLVFGPYYRGNNGSQGRDAFAGDDLQDVIVGVEILKKMYPNVPIHLIGFSRGGIQGLLTFQAVQAASYIIWGGVSDMHLMYEERVDLRGMLRRMIGHPKKQPEAYEQRDALRIIDHTAPPILIVHGGLDAQVGIHQAYHLAKHLEAKHARYETFYQMEEGHLPRPEALSEVLQRIQSWMDEVERNI
ncbi:MULTISPECIES: prolyl oligopeptidase family serine peptidase [unclassified Staphylococcus]|uniref:alpha/beta hydrolase family protein n=1 Tax=unclassified Staphylococcus TaxID=91994 RepID=UPI0021D05403|nr:MULTISPECIES: prolyl oligopeptidase family serine peptidase [unclassified Staphylococcus]UXR79080.1 prolyl oligopeptidase family serine peptidase [Staphylococcus sp. IVB6227]UXR81823.1 prolyl oligopeptidase family serine peptidase [Staphylococcus sp. IVB6214]